MVEFSELERWNRGSDPRMQRAIDFITPPGIAVAHRLISAGDELAVLPGEALDFAKSVMKVRRASGAARIAARQLMSRFGCAPQAIPKSAGGVPTWPQGIVGSLAHDEHFAIAALAGRAQFQGVGVDVEPAETLDPRLLRIFASPAERVQVPVDHCGGRLLFAIKEAVFKAVYPLDDRPLAFYDVEVNLSEGLARLPKGLAIHFDYCTQCRALWSWHTIPCGDSKQSISV